MTRQTFEEDVCDLLMDVPSDYGPALPTGNFPDKIGNLFYRLSNAPDRILTRRVQLS